MWSFTISCTCLSLMSLISMGSSWFEGQLSTVILGASDHPLDLLGVQVYTKSHWKIKPTSKLDMRGSNKNVLKCLCTLSLIFHLQNRRWYDSANHYSMPKPWTKPQASLIFCLFTLPPSSTTITPRWKLNMYFYWTTGKETSPFLPHENILNGLTQRF